MLRREPWATTEGIVRMLADFRGELERHAGARFFCARVDDEIAAMCELYVRGSIAQIEDVNTLEEFRNRGLARARRAAAADAARAGGADLVFLHALDDDWPKSSTRSSGSTRSARLVVRAAAGRVDRLKSPA